MLAAETWQEDPRDLPTAVSALQQSNGLAETGRLSRADTALLRAVHGPDTLGPTIRFVKAKLVAIGYRVGTVDHVFDREMQLAMSALSHDAGRPPDPTLSLENLRRLDAIDGPRPACAGSPDPFDLPTAAALVEHVEQLRPAARIVLIEPPSITGDRDLDQRIVERALERGYELRSGAAELASIEPGIDAGAQLAVAWNALRAAAERDGISVLVASGFRSIEQQRAIFVDRLTTVVGAPLSSFRTADAAIDQVLDSHAPPGFSKHQTGNAIDLAVPGSTLEQFRESEAFTWLSADVYANARRFGFVPSYPDGVPGLGPQPEPWEWLWVGVDVLFRCPPIS